MTPGRPSKSWNCPPRIADHYMSETLEVLVQMAASSSQDAVLTG
ncbi:MAG: hypothetical protein PVJ27_01355 [Candidatus Brocadiaceae bacterium]